MAEKLVIDPYDWKGASSDDLGYTGESLVTVALHRHENEHGQQFNVLEVDGRINGVGPTLIYIMPLDSRIDSFMETRMRILASQRHALVIAVEVPGITIDLNDPTHTRGAKQTIKQTFAAASGDYSHLVREQLGAINSVVPFKKGQEIEFFLESLAGSYGVAMVEELASGQEFERPYVSNMTLFDSVNAVDLSIPQLFGVVHDLTTIENPRRPLYLDENAAIGHGHIKPFEDISPENRTIIERLKKRQFLTTHLSAFGIRKSLFDGLKRASEDHSNDGLRLHEGQTTLIRAAHSTVSHESDLEILAQRLNEIGNNARVINFVGPKNPENPHKRRTRAGHAVLSGFARLTGLAQAQNDSYAHATKKNPKFSI